jgi:hypothetical protein
MFVQLVKYKLVSGHWPKMSYGGLERVYEKEDLTLAREIYTEARHPDGGGLAVTKPGALK